MQNGFGFLKKGVSAPRGLLSVPPYTPGGAASGNVYDVYANLAAFPVTGDTELFYIANDTKLLYYWTGSIYVETSPGAGGGGDTITSEGALINSAAEKTTPVDADMFSIRNSVGGLLAKFSWLNLKANLKTYFDSLVTTFTNKTINKRIQIIAESETIAVDTFANDISIVTGLSQNTTISNTGAASANDFEYELQITDNGISRLLTFSASFETGESTFPTATIPSEKLYVRFKYKTATSKHQCIWFGNYSKTVALAQIQTLTNKRVTKRAPVIAQSATPIINTDLTDYVQITGLAQAITNMTTNLSGAPVKGDTLRFSITDNGTARAITWGTGFESSGGATLPTTTVLGVPLNVGFVRNTALTKWLCIAVA